MSNPRTPARQRYYGPMYGDPLSQVVPHLTSSNPGTVERMRQRYGRTLAGFGGESMSGQVGYDPRYQGREVYDLERDDDTYGSGIFDPGGREGTSNPDMGVFASHDSLPGYVARQVPFTVSRDVTDINPGVDVVSVPGGGMVYVDQRGRLPERPAAPVGPVRGTPPGTLVPLTPPEGSVPQRSVVHGGQHSVPITAAARPVAAAAPDLPTQRQVPWRQTVNVAPAGRPLAIGSDSNGSDEGKSVIPLVVGGAIAGIAIGLFTFTVRGEKVW